MSDKPDTAKAVAELGESAATAALLSHGLQNLARLMEHAGAPDAALRVKALDILGLLALPPERAAALVIQLREAVSRFRITTVNHPARREDQEL